MVIAMGSKMEDYARFKDYVIQQLIESNTEYDILLLHFEKIIQSRRTCHQLRKGKSLKSLFEVLEQRDELSCDNVAVFKEIGSLAGVHALHMQVHQYEKHYGLSNCCETCNKSLKRDDELKSAKSILPICLQNTCIDDESSEEETDLDKAVEKIVPLVGRKWTDIARSLKLKEAEIDEIDYDCNRLREKIYKMFGMWRENFGAKATLAKLRKALLNSKRKDLADKI